MSAETVESKKWAHSEIKEWIESQTGPDAWYQTIYVKDGLQTPGKMDSLGRLPRLSLPDDMTGLSVLDIGCNSGMLCFEAKARNADRVVGIDLRRNRLQQARTLADIKEMDIDFREMDLFDATELGRFDIVFCIAVVTEIADLIGALLVLKQLTEKHLYLELATLEACQKNSHVLGMNLGPLLNLSAGSLLRKLPLIGKKAENGGYAQLRRVDSRQVNVWAMTPDKRFLRSIFGDEFSMQDLGRSVRYHLFRLTRQS